MGKLTESSDLANVLLIGDMNDSLLESLLANENSVSKQKNELLLDTKYYVARLKLISLKTVEAISEWKASASNLNVGAVIYNYDGEFCSMEKLKQQMSIWQTEIQVVVCKRLERSADWSDNLYHFCAAQQTELIELDPDAETIEDLNECHELYGIPRIWQVLEAGNWKDKIIKMNPLKSKEQRSFEKTGFPSSAAEKSSEDSFDDEESKLGDCDITEEDKEMILKLFGGPKVPFDSLMKDVDVPDPGVIEYFKQEMEKLKRQNKLAANKRRKKKKSKATVNEFGEFVDASNSTQMSNNVVTQNSSNVDSSNNEHARSALLKMPFGPERQNLAADTMTAVIKSIGDSDLFNSSSDDEPHT